MAVVNSKSAREIASFTKRAVNQIQTIRNRSSASAFTVRREAHTSIYQKNHDDQICPTIVPDELIELQSDKYWAPHPQTGVFGPANEQNSSVGGDGGSSLTKAGGSVLDEKAWFRPTSLEDLDKSSFN